MRAQLERGVSAAEAARLTLDEESAAAPAAELPVLALGVGELRAGLDRLDESAAHAALDRLLAGFSVETVLRVFGLGLRDRGWRVTFLGPDTPLDTLGDAATTLQPDAVVLAATTPEGFDAGRAALRRLARAVPVWAAGAGASPDMAKATGVQLLDLDPLDAAEHVTTSRAIRSQQRA
jgi:hypothetical protein